MTAWVMLPRVFPEGTSGEGGTQLCWEGPGPRCSITPRTSHVPAGLAARVISRQWDVWRCGATIFWGVARVVRSAILELDASRLQFHDFSHKIQNV